MSEFQSHPEIDDELLSAYLDGELSAEERARVDARLTSDPAARKLLDELQAASQAVRGLPHATVGEDLRESVLRRAEAAMLSSKGAQAAESRIRTVSNGAANMPDALPRLTIGRTRRGWVWAALAMAAGLVIMVYDRGERLQGDSDLPAIARNSTVTREAVDKVASAERAARPELRDWDAPESSAVELAGENQDGLATVEFAPPAAAPVTTGTATSESSTVALGVATPDTAELSSQTAGSPMRSGGLGGELADAPAPGLGQLGDEMDELNGSLATTANNGPAAAATSGYDRRPAEVPAVVVPPQGTVGSEGSFAGALAKKPAQADESDVLVVHVVVERNALANNAFDQLLAKNGIKLEETAGEETRPTPAASELFAERDSVERKLDRFAGEPQTEEVVLVAATRVTIEACLADLKQDQASFLGVSVDDTPAVDALVGVAAGADNSDIKAKAPAKNLATDLRLRFNRGMVPPQEEESARRKLAFDYYAGREQAAEGGRSFGSEFGGVPTQVPAQARPEPLPQQTTNELAQGRARRIQSSDLEGREARKNMFRGGAVAGDRTQATRRPDLGKLRRELHEASEPIGENLFVLFVLSPDASSPAAPPSPATQNRPE